MNKQQSDRMQGPLQKIEFEYASVSFVSKNHIGRTPVKH